MGSLTDGVRWPNQMEQDTKEVGAMVSFMVMANINGRSTLEDVSTRVTLRVMKSTGRVSEHSRQDYSQPVLLIDGADDSMKDENIDKFLKALNEEFDYSEETLLLPPAMSRNQSPLIMQGDL